MEAHSLFELSAAIKEEADALLEESKLVTFLRAYGDVKFAGSYSLNLMFNRDIDLYIVNAAHTEDSVLEALTALIRQGFFHGFIYYDRTRFPQPGSPNGYGISLRRPFRGNTWNIDLWWLFADLPLRMHLIQAIEQLDEKSKQALLRFKQIVAEKNLDIGSMPIYEAVLQKHITDEPTFLTYLSHYHSQS